MSEWIGTWNDNETSFTGTYTADDGKSWTGTAIWLDKHVMVHRMMEGYEQQVEMPIEPHWEFTGGGSIDPPPPE